MIRTSMLVIAAFFMGVAAFWLTLDHFSPPQTLPHIGAPYCPVEKPVRVAAYCRAVPKD